MCEFTQREFLCGHFLWLASKYCPQFKASQGPKCRRMPEITAFEERNIVCGECRLNEVGREWVRLYEAYLRRLSLA